MGTEELDIWSKVVSGSAAVVERDEEACVENEASLRDVDPETGINEARWYIARLA